jgi:hypothetical protein
LVAKEGETEGFEAWHLEVFVKLGREKVTLGRVKPWNNGGLFGGETKAELCCTNENN